MFLVLNLAFELEIQIKTVNEKKIRDVCLT